MLSTVVVGPSALIASMIGDTTTAEMIYVLYPLTAKADVVPSCLDLQEWKNTSAEEIYKGSIVKEFSLCEKLRDLAGGVTAYTNQCAKWCIGIHGRE